MASIQYIDAVGTFICRVEKPTAGWFGESKDKGTPFLRIPLVVEDSESDQDGRRIVSEHYITERTMDRLAKEMKKIFGLDDILALESEGETVPDGFTGQYCSIVTEADEYEGKTRIKVRWLNEVDYKPEQLAKEKVGSILSKFGSRWRAMAKSVPGPAPAAAKPVTAQPTEDDIPF